MRNVSKLIFQFFSCAEVLIDLVKFKWVVDQVQVLVCDNGMKFFCNCAFMVLWKRCGSSMSSCRIYSEAVEVISSKLFIQFYLLNNFPFQRFLVFNSIYLNKFSFLDFSFCLKRCNGLEGKFVVCIIFCHACRVEIHIRRRLVQKYWCHIYRVIIIL